MASYTLVVGKIWASLFHEIERCKIRGAGFLKMRVLRIIGMSATWRFRPGRTQARVAQTLQPYLGGVVSDNRVIAHQLEELAAGLSRRLVLFPVGDFLEQTVLLLRATVQEFVFKFRFAVRIHPAESRKEMSLDCGTEGSILGHFIAAVDWNAIRDHKVDELGNSCLPRTGSVIRWNDHLGQMLYQFELLWREKERLVGRLRSLCKPCVWRSVRTCKRPLAEARKGTRYGSEPNVTQDHPTFNPLSAHT